jgi:hypothetical protein
MLEPVMYAGLGFLAGCLLMVIFIPLVHERAVRLTARKFLAATPLSYAEMQAQKDLLRAEFAMSMRRVELSAEATKAKAVEQLCEVGKKFAEVHHLKSELAKTATLVQGLQARRRAHGSVTRRVVRLLLYIFARSRREQTQVALLPDSAAGGKDEWETLLNRFRTSLQKAEIAPAGQRFSGIKA